MLSVMAFAACLMGCFVADGQLEELISAQNRFAWQLLSSHKAMKSGNALVSPGGAFHALAMLHDMAAGETQASFQRLLGSRHPGDLLSTLAEKRRPFEIGLGLHTRTNDGYGLLIDAVDPQAADAGVEAGDLLFSVNEKDVRKPEQLIQIEATLELDLKAEIVGYDHSQGQLFRKSLRPLRKPVPDDRRSPPLWQSSVVLLRDGLALKRTARQFAEHWGAALIRFNPQDNLSGILNSRFALPVGGPVCDLAQGIDAAEAQFVLASVINFEAAWCKPFCMRHTENHPFHGPQGPNNVPFLQDTRLVNYAEVEGTKSIELKYRHVPYSMVFMLPADQEPTSRLIQRLAAIPRLFWAVRNNLRPTEVRIAIPKFDITSAHAVGKDLVSMGLTAPFGDQADFCAFFDASAPAKLSAVRQQSRMTVNETGSTANSFALTQDIGHSATAKAFVANRPFLAILQGEDGFIHVIAEVSEP